MGWRIVALEDQEEIFNALLKSMRKTTTLVVTSEPLMVVAATQDLNAMTIVPQSLHKSKFSK